jgi:hypothetical protein
VRDNEKLIREYQEKKGVVSADKIVGQMAMLKRRMEELVTKVAENYKKLNF